MSDFLTNLVTRSFASTASVQPVGASSPPGPQMVEDLPDPVVESAVTGDDFAAEDELVAPPGPRAANRSQKREAHSEATSVSDEQRPVIEEPSLELPLTVPGITIPPVASEPRSTSEPGPVSKETTNEVKIKSGSPPSDLGAPSTGVLQRRTTIQSSEDATTVQPLDPQPSIRRLLKRPGNALSLSPHISSLNSERTVSRMTEEAHPIAPERGVERTPAPFDQRELTITSLKADLSSAERPALIPKISTQPFLPLNVRTRPIASARDEHDEPAVAPLQETVINVAIGRIEVRATSAAAPKRERRANGPKVMNLDEYLHQRRGAT